MLDALGPFGAAVERFGDQLVNRVAGEVFGEGGAARAADVLIYNHTERNLYLVSSSFESGGFSPRTHLSVIPALSVQGYRVESHGLMTGVTGADMRFAFSPSDPTYCVRVVTSTPYAGDNAIATECAGGLQVSGTISVGNTCTAEIDVYPADVSET